MKFIRTILFGALIWILLYASWDILKNITLFKNNIIYFQIVFFSSVILIVTFCTYLYYRDNEINGFILGSIFALVSIIFNILILFPIFFKFNFKNFIFNYLIWTPIVIIIVVPYIYQLIAKLRKQSKDKTNDKNKQIVQNKKENSSKNDIDSKSIVKFMKKI
ncbi:MAG: hypothetical protein QW727_01875 [Candidatus Pacearchaeota archaeon]